MAELKKKVGVALGGLAMMIGAVPGSVGAAAAYENPNGGQHFDRGRFPRTIHIVLLAPILALVTYFAVRNNNDQPASP
jgi:Na+/H+ antiporter NhaD/arsenite permease-like protein